VWSAAVGCAKLRAPAGGWVRHGSGDDVTLLGCDTSSEQWELRCRGNEWITSSGVTAASINCTHGGYAVRSATLRAFRTFDASGDLTFPMFLILSSALLEVCALLSSIVVIIIIIIALVVDSSGLKNKKIK